MRNLRKYTITLLLVILLICVLCQPAFALTEEEVQAQIDAEGKEAVTGNVFIWFLCAIAFLKVSQKIDSFMSSLGINVGNTGGSMLSELMLAARSASGMKGGGGGGKAPSATGTAKDAGAGFLSGGLAGVVGRKVVSSAVKAVTTQDSSNSIGAKAYTSSLSHNGDFANSVIGTVATGNISQIGSITGEKAENALKSYIPNSDDVQHTNVEIGGGRIMGTEKSQGHPDGISFGMYNTAQYMPPQGDYSTVQAADGTSWYKQYAQNSTLTEIPKRKDRI